MLSHLNMQLLLDGGIQTTADMAEAGVVNHGRMQIGSGQALAVRGNGQHMRPAVIINGSILNLT